MGLLAALMGWLTGPSVRPAPIATSPHKAGIDRDYRIPGDPKHVIRINQQWPEGLGASVIKKLGPYRDGVPVAGVSHEEREKSLAALIRGSERRLELIRDPTNKHDPNAIKVIGHWRDKDGLSNEGQIGWLPREIAREIAKEYPNTHIGARILLMYQPRRGKNPGIRIDIGPPSKRKQGES